MLTPSRIINKNLDGSLNNKEAIENLTLLVESSKDPTIRVESLEALEKINMLKNNNNIIFEIFENCVISDENPTIQYIAAKILLQKFPKKAREPLLWIIHHTNSVYLKLRFIKLFKAFNSQFYNDLVEKFIKGHTRKYSEEGVCPDEATILWLLEDLDGRILKKIDLEEEIPCVVKFYDQDCYYKINSRGNIVGIYISSYPNRDITYNNNQDSHFHCKSINFIPEQICSLTYLEEFYLNSPIPHNDYPDSILTLKRAMERGYNGHDRKALEINPRYSLAWYRLAKNLYDKLNYTESLDACFKCLEIDPNFQAALMLRDTILNFDT